MENPLEVYETLPIVPLRDVVVFQHMMMPFVIGRPSSTRALEHALLKDKRIFLAAQHDASVDDPRPEDIFTMGCVANVVQSLKLPDGNVKVLLDETHLGGSDMPLAGNPKHLGIDAQDNVLICDELNHLLRKYLPAEGKLATLMGDGKPGTGGVGGPAEKAQLKNPHGVLFHHGAIYVADSGNDRVLKISAD